MVKQREIRKVARMTQLKPLDYTPKVDKKNEDYIPKADKKNEDDKHFEKNKKMIEEIVKKRLGCDVEVYVFQ